MKSDMQEERGVVRGRQRRVAAQRACNRVCQILVCVLVW